MALFNLRHHNRAEFPTKHVVIAEDDIGHQMEFMQLMNLLFARQGKIRVSVVSGSAAIAAIMSTEPVDLLILDFDMPYGNAIDFIQWMIESGRRVPIITASGWEPNNETFRNLLTDTDIWHRIFTKSDVLCGKANEHILRWTTESEGEPVG